MLYLLESSCSPFSTKNNRQGTFFVSTIFYAALTLIPAKQYSFGNLIFTSLIMQIQDRAEMYAHHLWNVQQIGWFKKVGVDYYPNLLYLHHFS